MFGLGAGLKSVAASLSLFSGLTGIGGGTGIGEGAADEGTRAFNNITGAVASTVEPQTWQVFCSG